MKKKVFFLLIAVLAFNIFAQGLSLGIKGGISMANIVGDDAPDNSEMKFGGIGGVSLTYDFNDIFSIQPEILFSMKGADFGTEETVVDGNSEYYYKSENSLRFNYISIPILPKINFNLNNDIKGNFLLGPNFGFNIKAEGDYETIERIKENGVTVYSSEEKITFDLKKANIINDFDFSIIVGAGLEFNNINLDLRYDLGLTTIVDSNEDESAQNSTFSVLLGYSFDI